MRFKSFTLAVCVWAAVCATHAETLVVLGDDAYSPVVYTDQGKPAGILPTILTRISALTGDDYKVQLSPWKRAYALALRAEGGVVGFLTTRSGPSCLIFPNPFTTTISRSSR